MKRILIMLLCVFIVSICASSAFASDDFNGIKLDDCIPTFDNNNFFVSVDGGCDYDLNMTQFIYPEDIDESNANQTDDVGDDSIPTFDNDRFFVSVDGGCDYDLNMTQFIYPEDIDEPDMSQTAQY